MIWEWSGREALPRDQRPSDHDAAGRAARAVRLAPKRMRRRSRQPAERATDRELAVVAAVIAAGSEKAAAHRLGLSHSTVKHHLANARFKVGGDDHSAARVDPGASAAGARGRTAGGRVASEAHADTWWRQGSSTPRDPILRT
jgi:DNA-binding NarL/FixJ family response regulator